MKEASTRYSKVKLLGRGGMGEVWLVHDRKLNCDWAMKRLHSNTDEDTCLRFEQEIQILEKLQHPAIPSIVERLTDQGCMAAVMDLVEGKSLSHYPHDISEARLMDWALQILDVVAHIHEQGILYLDLKPDNILLDRKGQIHLIDFGSAICMDCQDQAKHYGTIGYAPKEQYERDALDERCDIYAFGKTLIALSLQVKENALLEHLTGEDTPLSQGFRYLINGCIEPCRELRYASIACVMEDLREMQGLISFNQKHLEAQKRLQKCLWIIGTICLLLGGCLFANRSLCHEVYPMIVDQKNPLVVSMSFHE